MKKIIVLIFAVLMVFCSFTVVSPVTAYSSEVTGLRTSGFENNIQTYAEVGGYHIFAFDNKLIFYDANSVLQKTWTITPATNITNANADIGNCYAKWSTSIMAFDSDEVLVVQSYPKLYYYAGTDVEYIIYNYGFLNVNTLGWTKISDGWKNPQTDEWTANDELYTSNMIIKNTNSTGDFYYTWISVMAKIESGASDTYNCQDFIRYIGKFIGGTWYNGDKQEYFRSTSSTTAQNYMNRLNIIIDASSGKTPANTAFLISSNNWEMSNRANIYYISMSPAFTVSFIGVTSLDNSYGGSYDDGTYRYTPFVQLMGLDTGDSKIEVIVSYSLPTFDRFGITTLVFNTTVISDYSYNEETVTDSIVCRPFAYSAGSGIYPSAGTWGMAYFADVYTSNKQDLIGLDVEWSDVYGWQDANNHGYIWTPELQQEFPSGYSANANFGGFQPNGKNIGIFVDLSKTNFADATGKAVANPMVATASNAITWNLYLNGGGFTNQLINQQTLYELQQSVSYTFTATFINSYGTTDVSGDLSAISSSLNVYSTILTTFTGSTFTQFGYSVTTQAFTNGVCNFAMSPRTHSSSVYQVIIFNFTTTEQATGSRVYWFKFLAPTELPTGATPTPTYYGGGSGGFGTGDTTQMVNFFVYFLLLFLPPILLGGIIGRVSRSGMGVLIGFIGGLVLMMVVGVIVGFIPFWAIIIIGVMLIVMAILALRSFA